MHRVISMSVVVVVLIVVVMLTNIIRLWRSAQVAQMEIPLRVLGFSDLSGQILINPSSQIFETSKTLYLSLIHI